MVLKKLLQLFGVGKKMKDDKKKKGHVSFPSQHDLFITAIYTATTSHHKIGLRRCEVFLSVSFLNVLLTNESVYTGKSIDPLSQGRFMFTCPM
jgi:hypothetical protein